MFLAASVTYLTYIYTPKYKIKPTNINIDSRIGNHAEPYAKPLRSYAIFRAKHKRIQGSASRTPTKISEYIIITTIISMHITSTYYTGM